VAARLKAPLFSQVIYGPSGDSRRLFDFALKQWPNLMSETDYASIRKRLTPKQIETALHRTYNEFLQPTGFLQKNMLLADPLRFRELLFARLASLNPLGSARVVNGHFLSKDGRETMLLIETPVPITNFKGARTLLAELNRVLKQEVPDNITATVLSGHLYTVANATAIQKDMVVVIGASLAALLLLFFIFMREYRALSVFLLPVIVLGPALALTGLIDGSISAITIGFGAVLLGIAIDYGLHIYFAFKSGTRSPAATLQIMTPPLLGAALTTIGAFSVQLLSALPGQRQLALFAICGIILALLLALFVLPHLLHFNLVDNTECKSYRQIRHPRQTVALWLIVMALLLSVSLRVDCSGDLRQVNLVPESLRQAEKSLKSVWGEVRGRALVFARGETLEKALQANENLYRVLRLELEPPEIVSLAPILPSHQSQSMNRERWHTFWSHERLDELSLNLTRTGAEMGFAKTAFTPFIDNLKQQPPILTESFWKQTGVTGMLKAMVSENSTGTTILTLIPDRISAGLKKRCAGLTGVHLVSPKLFNRKVSRTIRADLRRFIGLALILVSLILWLLLRNFYQAFLALLPVLAGLLSMFGVMGLCGITFNIFNLVAAILIIGLGVDYGIFMVYRLFRGSSQTTEKAVLVSALTTLAGFGVLVLARHPALNSIGLTVLLGVGGALPTVLWVLPAFAGLRKKN
jgi:predicted exporter